MRTVVFAWRAAGRSKWGIFAGNLWVAALTVLDALLVWKFIEAAQAHEMPAPVWILLTGVRLAFSVKETSVSQGHGKIPRLEVARAAHHNLLYRGQVEGAAASKIHTNVEQLADDIELTWYACNGLLLQACAMLFIIGVAMGPLPVVGFAALLGVTVVIVWRRVKKRRKKVEVLVAAREKLKALAAEHFDAVTSIKMNGLTTWCMAAYDKLHEQLKQATIREAREVAWASASLYFMADIFIVLIVLAANLDYGPPVNAVLLVAQFLKMRYLLTAFHATLNRIQKNVEEAKQLAPDIEDFDPALDTPVLHDEGLPRGAAIELQNVQYSYDGVRNVIDEMSVRFEPRQVTLVKAPNGAGKSTMLRIATGVLEPTRGSILVGGKPPTESMRRYGIACATSDDKVNGGATVREVLTSLVPGCAVSDEQMHKALEVACLEHITDLGAKVWDAAGSDGLRRLLANARTYLKVLVEDVSWMIFDEPTTYVDAKTTPLVLPRLVEFARTEGVGCLVVTHDSGAESHFDRAVGLAGGKIIRDEVQE